jgi:ribonuclease D
MPPDASKSPRGRRSRRDQQHQASHADASSLSPIPDHRDVPSETATLVVDAAGLDDAIEHLSAHDVIAYDTEFIGEESYYPELCLIQVGSRERVFLVDPFEFEDLCPLLEVLASPDRITLVHAGRQDLQILSRLLGRPALRVVDTQILAGLAGLPWPCSLTKSVQCVINAPMPSGMTFTAWDARPLSAKQVRYAADDVRYLPLLHAFLMERIETYGHSEWADEACAVFDDPAWHHNDLSNQQRKLEGSRRLRTVERRILQHLIETRDAIARSENKPPRAVLPDNVLMGLTRDRPESAEAIGHIKGMPRPIATRHGDTMLASIDAARESSISPPPATKKDDAPEDRVAVDSLWHAFCASALAVGVSPAIALSRADMAAWYLGGCNGHPGRAPWQQTITAALLAPLREPGQSLDIQWRAGVLQHACEEPNADQA